MLEQDNMPTLQTLIAKIEHVGSSSLQVALSRFNRQCGREDLADRLIDALIAFEALYLRGAREELGYRLALRGAAHLGGRGTHTRAEVFELLRTAYALRGEIAHGVIADLPQAKAVRKAGWACADDMLTSLTDLLRLALRLVLLDIGEQAFNTEFHATLDKSIVSGEFEAAGMSTADGLG